MTSLQKRATAALAYALYDSEHTSRLSQNPDAQPEYFERAERLLFMIHNYRPDKERVAIARAISESTVRKVHAPR